MLMRLFGKVWNQLLIGGLLVLFCDEGGRRLLVVLNVCRGGRRVLVVVALGLVAVGVFWSFFVI
ncbi:hypothetical protein HanRHA438_Chr14g0648111 [Helianthus annuus]|nr:hypothetical protein HanRHA438_Chr14g0648111 [Helianthus annuus]